MHTYLLFFLMAAGLILSPGPGVIKSINNAIHYGVPRAVVGVAGLVSGVLLVSILSATSLGLLIATSPRLFGLLKLAGVAYLFYLGARALRRPPLQLGAARLTAASRWQIFSEGLLLQLANPNALLFFFSVLPQFIDHKADYRFQFVSLALLFCLLMSGIHTGYVLLAHRARRWIEHHPQAFNRLTAGLFFGFGLLFLR